MVRPFRVGSCRLLEGDLPLPGDLLGEAGVETNARLPAEVPVELAGVGAGVALVAGAGRFMAYVGPAADDRFQLVQDVPDRGRLAAADVVGFAERGRERGDRRLDAVADEGVAPPLL